MVHLAMTDYFNYSPPCVTKPIMGKRSLCGVLRSTRYLAMITRPTVIMMENTPITIPGCDNYEIRANMEWIYDNVN